MYISRSNSDVFVVFVFLSVFVNCKSICLFQVDVNSSLEKQGPLHVFLHKLTDMQSHAENGDKNVWEMFV